MRLIDADALEQSWDVMSDGHIRDFYDIDEIEQAPTVDAVEVVRCENCIHHTNEAREMVYCPAVIGSWVENDFYCADGERKEAHDAET